MTEKIEGVLASCEKWLQDFMKGEARGVLDIDEEIQEEIRIEGGLEDDEVKLEVRQGAWEFSLALQEKRDGSYAWTLETEAWGGDECALEDALQELVEGRKSVWIR